jgi:hypothetical protein
MGPSVEIQHCLLIRQGMPDESWRVPGSTDHPPLALRGVRYFHRVPPDTEFPNDSKSPWAVYLRVTGRRVGPTRVLFRIDYLNPRDGWQEVSRIPCWTAIPLPVDDEATQDVVLNLPYLRLGGVGLHAITVHFWYDGVELDENAPLRGGLATDVADPEVRFGTPDWAFGAVDYFWIERPS